MSTYLVLLLHLRPFAEGSHRIRETLPISSIHGSELMNLQDASADMELAMIPSPQDDPVNTGRQARRSAKASSSRDTVCEGAHEAEMIEDPVVAYYLEHRNNAAVDPSLEDPAEKGLKRVYAN